MNRMTHEKSPAVSSRKATGRTQEPPTFEHTVVKTRGMGCLTLALLNKLRCHSHFKLPANQIPWSGFWTEIHIFNDKQCGSRSVGFSRSQLIWIYTVCKGWIYPGSAGQGLNWIYWYQSTKITLIIDQGALCLSLIQQVLDTSSVTKWTFSNIRTITVRNTMCKWGIQVNNPLQTE